MYSVYRDLTCTSIATCTCRLQDQLQDYRKLYYTTCTLHVASYPGLPSQLFLQPWKKAWVRPGSKHYVTLAIDFVTTRVHGFICTRDVFHVAYSGTLAALCSRDTRYSIVGEPDGSW